MTSPVEKFNTPDFVFDVGCDDSASDSKKCSKCKEHKELYEFSRNRSNKDGLQKQCKRCAKATKKLCEDNARAADPVAWTAKHTNYKRKQRERKRQQKPQD